MCWHLDKLSPLNELARILITLKQNVQGAKPKVSKSNPQTFVVPVYQSSIYVGQISCGQKRFLSLSLSRASTFGSAQDLSLSYFQQNNFCCHWGLNLGLL